MTPVKKPARLFQNLSLHSSKIQAHTQTVMKSKMKENWLHVAHTVYTIATLYRIATLGEGNRVSGRSED